MFDQYGTVVDMQKGLTEMVTPYLREKGWSGRPDALVTWWRRTHFEHSMIDALCDRGHTPYRQIGHRAVSVVMDRAGIPYTQDEVQWLVSQIETLKPFPDAIAALDSHLTHPEQEKETVKARFEAILAMDTPKLLPIDPDRWAEERQYLRNEAEGALRAFRRRREELLTLLRKLGPEQWQRAGMHASFEQQLGGAEDRLHGERHRGGAVEAHLHAPVGQRLDHHGGLQRWHGPDPLRCRAGLAQ